uniref:G-protein coupled receptors family 1 profile domain-containing protein n=1 Tax=Meloidogyne enterolobii TaxID=390850 RepID=A0A6V7XA26_MELEN|nr:unnamed protein product [Meloidogyne enterolobii]
MNLESNSGQQLQQDVSANSPKNIHQFNEQHSNWTEMDCGWLDEIREIQNHFYWRHTNPALLLCLYAAVCFFGAIANFFVLLSFARVAQLRNLRNYFIANLAFSDLLMCTITAPVTLYLSLNFFWPFGKFACQLVASIQAVNMFVSCLTLVLIALDRFLLTLCPVKWRLAAKAPLICYLFVWICSFIVAAPYGAAVSAEYARMLDPWNSANVEFLLPICDREQPQICMEDVKRWDRLPFSRRTYTLTVLAIQYLLPLSALAIAYSQIGSTIRRRGKASTTVHGERKQQIQRRNRKAMFLLLGLVLVYAIAWAPMNIYNVLHVLEFIAFSQYNYLFCHLIGMVSASINPLLYALINESFRAAFLQLIQPLLKLCFLNFNSRTIRNREIITNNIPQHETISSALILGKKMETPPTKRTLITQQNEENNGGLNVDKINGRVSDNYFKMNELGRRKLEEEENKEENEIKI